MKSKTVKDETSQPVDGNEEKTLEKSGENTPRVSGSPANNDPADLQLSLTEEEMASAAELVKVEVLLDQILGIGLIQEKILSTVEAATTKIRDSVAGTDLEIVLGPAKPSLSPEPARKLQKTDGRKAGLEEV